MRKTFGVALGLDELRRFFAEEIVHLCVALDIPLDELQVTSDVANGRLSVEARDRDLGLIFSDVATFANGDHRSEAESRPALYAELKH